MSKELKDIKQFLQHVTEIFASVVDIELCITNRSLEVIAGTGYFTNNIGLVYPKGCMTEKMTVSSNEEKLFVCNTKNSNICSKCNYFKSCDVLAFLMCPILYLEERIGTFSLIALTGKQQNKLCDEYQTMLKFLNSLCNFIATTLNGKAMENKVNTLVSQYNTLINSLHEGIIAVDCDGGIININQSAKNILRLDDVDVRNENIHSLFPEIRIQTLLNKKSYKDINEDRYYERELQYVVDNCTYIPLLYNITFTYDKTRITGAVISFREKKDLRMLANKILGEEKKYTFAAIKGSNEKLIEIKHRMKNVANSNSTVLICGETGTGKNIFARAIHEYSFRNDKPFVSVNCAAIPTSLIESELFGYEEGAFTGAKKGGKPGKVEKAHEGTLFLDEIGDMPLDLQSKLLQLLDTKKIERVGDINTKKIDVRIIAATNQDLDRMVKEGSFRSDLYYRISVIPFFIPPLKERRDDIPMLIDYYLTIYNAQLSKSIRGFDDCTRKCLINYHWPGNVRELKNAIEYAVNIEESDKITIASLPPKILDHHGEEKDGTSLQFSLSHLEKNAIIKALHAFGTDNQGKEKAATKLGISRATLYRKIKYYGIETSTNNLE